MHEMGIVLEILEISASAVPKGLEGVRVDAINLKVGKLSGVVPESLRSCFEIARRDTPFSGASLAVEEVPVVVLCGDCGAETVIEEAAFACRACAGRRLSVIAGRELTVVSIELADPEGPAAAEG